MNNPVPNQSHSKLFLFARGENWQQARRGGSYIPVLDAGEVASMTILICALQHNITIPIIPVRGHDYVFLWRFPSNSMSFQSPLQRAASLSDMPSYVHVID